MSIDNEVELTLKLVVADDEQQIRRLFPRILRKLEGRVKYEIHLAKDGREALDLIDELGGAEIVVTDYRMPNMLGSELLENVRKRYPDASRVLMSGTDPFPSNGLAQHYMEKPFSVDTVKHVLESATREYLKKINPST